MRYKKLFEVAIMEVKVKSISINSPAVKINTELKTIDLTAPEKKCINVGNAVMILPTALISTFGNATVIE